MSDDDTSLPDYDSDVLRSLKQRLAELYAKRDAKREAAKASLSPGVKSEDEVWAIVTDAPQMHKSMSVVSSDSDVIQEDDSSLVDGLESQGTEDELLPYDPRTACGRCKQLRRRCRRRAKKPTGACYHCRKTRKGCLVKKEERNPRGAAGTSSMPGHISESEDVLTILNGLRTLSVHVERNSKLIAEAKDKMSKVTSGQSKLSKKIRALKEEVSSMSERVEGVQQAMDREDAKLHQIMDNQEALNRLLLRETDGP